LAGGNRFGYALILGSLPSARLFIASTMSLPGDRLTSLLSHSARVLFLALACARTSSRDVRWEKVTKRAGAYRRAPRARARARVCKKFATIYLKYFGSTDHSLPLSLYLSLSSLFALLTINKIDKIPRTREITLFSKARRYIYIYILYMYMYICTLRPLTYSVQYWSLGRHEYSRKVRER